MLVFDSNGTPAAAGAVLRDSLDRDCDRAVHDELNGPLSDAIAPIPSRGR